MQCGPPTAVSMQCGPPTAVSMLVQGWSNMQTPSVAQQAGCNTREMYSFILYMKEGHFTLMPTPQMRQQRGGRGRGAHGSRKVKPD